MCRESSLWGTYDQKEWYMKYICCVLRTAHISKYCVNAGEFQVQKYDIQIICLQLSAHNNLFFNIVGCVTFSTGFSNQNLPIVPRKYLKILNSKTH